MTDLPPPILTKKEMYRRLQYGAFGNTVPQYYSVEEWEACRHTCANYGMWGLRSGLAGGDRRMRLNVPEAEVAALYREWYPNRSGNISPMIDRFAVLRGEVCECPWSEPHGPYLFYVPPGQIDAADPWRGSFRKFGQHAHGLQAWMLLKAHLWPSDLEDLKALLELYPGHTVEFSSCDREVGLIPNRNTCIWEVRRY